MSRINDALGRALSSPTPNPEVTLPMDAVRRSEQSALDAYAHEGARPDTPPDGSGLAFRAITTLKAGRPRPFEPVDAAGSKLVVSEGVGRVEVEQYRRLAGVMHEMQVNRGLKTLMVTSALPGEGKTLTVVNLALTLSESFHRRVLLIDADLRRPSVHQLFALSNAIGLSDVLRSKQLDIPLIEVSTHLSVLPAGASDSNPMAGLTSERMRLLLERAAGEYDWVLLDAAPVGLMPDARLLADLTRAVLFVIGAGSTPYPLIARALAEIGRECLLGTVLNRVDPHNVPATAYYDNYYLQPAAGDLTPPRR